MALRTIRIQGDPVLEKECRPVKEVTPKITELIDDMLETMYDACGVGLAAPQVGVLRRIVVIDVGEGPIVMINPEIIETSGEQTGDEGCLSVPGKRGDVCRYRDIDIVYSLADGTARDTLETVKGFTAVIFQHECDHLDGILYTEHVIGEIHDTYYEEEE